jgi:hypothetical protein
MRTNKCRILIKLVATNVSCKSKLEFPGKKRNSFKSQVPNFTKIRSASQADGVILEGITQVCNSAKQP